MRKVFVFVCIALPVWTAAVSGQELLDSAEQSVNHAMGRPPVAYHYLEKAGAIGINRKKEREYVVEESDNGLVSRVTFADDGKHHKDDPRTPAQVGDTAAYDFAMIINNMNPFESELEARAIREGEIQKIDDVETQGFVFECTTTDDEGSFPSAGELFIDIETGMLRRIRVERLEFPEDLHFELWILDFDGTGPDDCRLVEHYYESRGKYAIFTYKFRTTDSFIY
jgi:hypothetical protein